MYFSPRKLLLSHNTTTATLFVKAVATCHCYLLCASDPNCTQIAQLDEVDRYPPPPPPSAAQKSNNMAMLLILMLSILGAAFLCLCYFTIMKRYRSNLTTSSSRRVFLSIFSDANGEGFSDDNHGHHPIWYIQTVGLQDSVIDSIPVFRYKKGDGLVEGSDCSVCLSEFEDDESLRLLPKCSHAFHLPCIDTWLRSHKNCPLCRAPIVRDEVSAAVDPTPESGDAMADDDDDEQVNHGNEGESPPSDELGKIVGGRVFSDLGDHRVRTGDDRLQGVRRCLSMDLPSASRIYGVSGQVGKIQPIYEEGSSSGGDDDHQKKPNRRSSSRKSFSFLPIRMKRSFSSSSGKSSASRSQDLV